MSRLVQLTAGGERGPWERIGLRFADATSQLSDVAFVVSGGEPGLVSWTISTDADAAALGDGSAGTQSEVSVDGITTYVVTAGHLSVDGQPTPAPSVIGPTTGVRLDHVVVNTDDGERTSSALESVLGLPLRRVRDAGRGVSQRFHTLDNCVIEVVSGPHITDSGARLWGMVLSVADIDALATWLGPDVMSAPKTAVQEGRRIATVRASAGLGIPFAVMSPHVRAGLSGTND